MKLLTAELIKKIPELGTQDGKDLTDIPIIIKFFHPFSSWTWYVTEGHCHVGGDWEFFGLVRGHEVELGPFMLSELEEVKIHGLGIERDRHFGEHTLAEAMEERI
jgi:hypothetical protein